MCEIDTAALGSDVPNVRVLPAEIDAVVRKVAWRLIPILFLAYVINFIDRVNISFAKLQMSHALGLDDVAFGVGAGMFFIGYFFFEVPSNMILERIGARRWVPIIMLTWGLATAAVEFLEGYAGLAGWQWLMIATGLPCLLAGVGIYLLLTDHPDQALWLSARERQVLKVSLGSQERPKTSVKAGLLNFWSWNSAWIYFQLVCGGYGVSFWMPTLFSQAGVKSSAEIGLLVAMPNLVGVIAMLLICHHSDRTRERRWHLAACFTFAAIGYAVIAGQLGNVAGLLIGLSIAHVGILAGVPLSWTIPTRMLMPSAAAVGIAIVALVGNLGGFAAPVLIGKLTEATGDLVTGFLAIGVLLLLGAVWTALSVRIPR